MGVSRQFTGDDKRGNSYDRRARRAWLVSERAGFGGDGVKVPCWECGKLLTEDEVVSDRIVPGYKGGRYVRSNIRPQCATCSHKSGPRERAEQRAESDPFTEDGMCKTCGVEFWFSRRNGHAVGCTVVEVEW
ncbi:HNH endonuclease [Mycobacterium phage Imvubu]|uniref:HNH endonuclease n=1 Tax=Mycobacterium phage Imvubu TaxID=2686233 RepID=A0A6B9L873_9CAUD|nr:HNH endonuclease [Mycobacterium phage Imvubu]QHB37820.1 HNH endonuclease [Mycobacterium phage Imvubu]